MPRKLRYLVRNLLQGLWFIPGVIVFFYGALAVALVEADRSWALAGRLLFEGDEAAARTVLSVLAGSLITVAGLTFSITIVVLQLASTQFSPRVLRTFFGDRITQVTVGTYVGGFVYALIVLRSVGSYREEAVFVPRLSVTLASAFGIWAVILLIVFIHHISRLIQVSHVTANIAKLTLEGVDAVYAGRGQPPTPLSAYSGSALEAWRTAETPGRLTAGALGYVQQLDAGALAGTGAEPLRRAVVLIRPGDFVRPDTTIAEVWPAALAEHLQAAVPDALSVGDERDMVQDVDFGLRQLTDIALRALSPSVNDPTTADTAVQYLRTILVRLAKEPEVTAVRRSEISGADVLLCDRSFEEYFKHLRQISRAARDHPVVLLAVVDAFADIAAEAARAGLPDRAHLAVRTAEIIAGDCRASLSADDHEELDAAVRSARAVAALEPEP